MNSVSIRGPRPTDQSYIANSWVSSIAGPRGQWGAKERTLNTQVDRLLDDPRTKLLVAVEPDDDDRIVGWVAFARIPGARVLEFLLVRKQRRGEGIAKQLLECAELLGKGAPLTCLFRTDRITATYTQPEDFL